MQPTSYNQVLDDWLDGRYDLCITKHQQQQADDLFAVDTLITHHATARAAQRGIDGRLLPLLAVSGILLPAGEGCTFTYVSEQEAREMGCPQLANLAAILSPRGAIITAYRVAHAPKEWGPHRQRRLVRRQLRHLKGTAA